MVDETTRQQRQPRTEAAKGALTGFVETVGDLATTTVKTAVDVGDEMIHGAGQLTTSVVDEVGGVLATATSRLRGAFGNLVRSGRSQPPP